MSRHTLTSEQAAEAQRITEILMETARREVQDIAELLASKPDQQILGKTEFEVRDRVHKIGAKAIETALNERKKGATKGPVRVARTARDRANSRTVGTKPSSA